MNGVEFERAVEKRARALTIGAPSEFNIAPTIDLVRRAWSMGYDIIKADKLPYEIAADERGRAMRIIPRIGPHERQALIEERQRLLSRRLLEKERYGTCGLSQFEGKRLDDIERMLAEDEAHGRAEE